LKLPALKGGGKGHVPVNEVHHSTVGSDIIEMENSARIRHVIGS
jgi:hypothetical protein